MMGMGWSINATAVNAALVARCRHRAPHRPFLLLSIDSIASRRGTNSLVWDEDLGPLVREGLGKNTACASCSFSPSFVRESCSRSLTISFSSSTTEQKQALNSQHQYINDNSRRCSHPDSLCLQIDRPLPWSVCFVPTGAAVRQSRLYFSF